MELPQAFSLEYFEAHLRERVSDKNRDSVMRVVRRLVNGRGVEHKSKPEEAFLKGHNLSPQDDLEAIRNEAAQWLPFKKGDDCLDKGHGWALNHPLQKLIDYKKHVLLNVPDGETKKASRKRKATEPDPMDNAMRVLKMKLKTAVDDGSITQQESEAKKRQILGFIDQELATINVADEVAPPPVPVPAEEGEH
jgi:hypothetical protein